MLDFTSAPYLGLGTPPGHAQPIGYGDGGMTIYTRGES